MHASETSKVYISVSDHVMSKTRSELVSNGELELSLLNEIHATWKRKMIQAGVISGTLETSEPPPLQTHDPNPLPVYAERGIDIDAKELEMFIDAQFPSTEREMFIENEHEGFYIPQKDGSGDGDGDAPTNEDDEELNEDDDIEEEDDNDIPDLINCQFDYVKKKNKTKNKSKKNYWDCKFKAGVMHINGKDILFSEGKGDFDF